MIKCRILHIPTGTYVSYVEKDIFSDSIILTWRSCMNSKISWGEILDKTESYPVEFTSKTRAKLWLRQHRNKEHKNNFELLEIKE